MPTLEPTSEDTRVYEICVLYPYPLSQKEESNAQKEVEDFLKETGGKEIAKDAWGRRGLAYNIGGYTEGSFVIYYYELDPTKLDELDHNLRISKSSLRHMIIKPPKGYQIIEYSKRYEEWLKEREVEEETLEKQKEEDLKKKMLERQKRQTKRTEDKKTPEKEKAAPAGKEITAEIDKLIADDELEI